MKKIFLSLILVIILAYPAIPQKVLHPYNLDFEDGELNRMPIGWIHPTYSHNNGYKARLSDYKPQSGKFCLEISRDTTGFVEGMYGSIMQSIEAKPFRGKKMIFRAAIKAQIASKKGAAHLWIRVKLKNDEDGNVDLSENQPIIYGDWQFYQMELEINDYADQINYGLMLDGGGIAWIDNVSISSGDEKKMSNFKTITLNDEQLNNLYAFSRIYGELRYFNPTTVGQKMDWDKFSIYGVQTILNSKEDKFTVLDKLFSPIAPTLWLSESLSKEKKFDYLPVPGIAISYLRYITSYKDLYDSKPVNVYQPQKEAEGTVLQLINISDLKLKKVKMKFKVKFDSEIFNSFAQALIRLDDQKDKVLKLVSFQDIPAKTDGWQEYTIESEVPQNTTFLRLGLSLAGDGEVFYDCVSAKGIDNNNKEIEISVKNACFESEEPGKLSKGWKLSSVSEKAGYTANIVIEEENKILKIYSNPQERAYMPLPKEQRSYSDDILNFTYKYDLSLEIDSNGTTLPYSIEAIEMKKILSNTEFDLSDYYSRIAVVINIWNYLIHFHINNIVYKNILLNEFISKAAISQDITSFIELLNELIAYSNDSQARVWFKNEEKKYALPFLIKKQGNQYFVSKSLDKEIIEGSKINIINGIAANLYFDGKIEKISGNNPEYKYLRAIAEFRAGNLNEKVNLTINNKVYTIGKTIQLNSLNEDRPSQISLIDSTIYYIDLTRLNDDDIKSNLKIFINAKNIIFDLRGITQVSDHFLGLFTDKNLSSLIWKVTGFSYPNKENRTYKLITNTINTRKLLNTKNIFLIDTRTIGYSEVLAYLINKYNIGETLGLETSGSLGESIPINYFNDINISFTGLNVFNNDEEITFKRVKPTILINESLENYLENDILLEKAINILKINSTK